MGASIVRWNLGAQSSSEDNIFLAGQAVLDALHDDIQMWGLVDKIQVIGVDCKNRAYIERLQPIIIIRFEKPQVVSRDTRFDFATAASDAVQ